MNLPSFLTAEQKADIKQSLRDQRLRNWMNYCRQQDCKNHMPPAHEIEPKEVLVYNYADSKEVRATLNHLENRVNGLLKMGHSHSKSVRGKYNTYSV